MQSVFVAEVTEVLPHGQFQRGRIRGFGHEKGDSGSWEDDLNRCYHEDNHTDAKTPSAVRPQRELMLLAESFFLYHRLFVEYRQRKALVMFGSDDVRQEISTTPVRLAAVGGYRESATGCPTFTGLRSRLSFRT
jgi:hypothetical protein